MIPASLFSIARLPRIEFGRGAFDKLFNILPGYGKHLLLVTGRQAVLDSDHWQRLIAYCKKNAISWQHVKIDGEPSPQMIDEVVSGYQNESFDVVVGIGGGSALDAAKAIAGLLNVKHSVMDYLEGVGVELAYQGPAVPFVAVPTTAGTGSEATKNAVLSVHGDDGFKKSFRDEQLVAEYAIVDPDLLASCPAPLIAANGMDALTQLMESYVSTRSNLFTDSLIIPALAGARDGLIKWYQHGAEAPDAMEKMAYAALISGICLAQTGLGSVHGLASPLGAFYPIPHGVVCGTLVAEATKKNIDAMLEREEDNPALAKYKKLSETLCQSHHRQADEAFYAMYVLLGEWIRRMKLPLLSEYGVTEDGLDHVVAHCRGSSMQTNPIVLTDAEVRHVLSQRL